MGETIVRPFPMWLYIQTWHNQLFGSQKSILYRSQIGALRWNVESTSSQRYRNYHWCSWCPAKVILADAVVRYPEKQHNARAGLCLIKQALLWLTSFYGEARKAIPPDAPAPRRKEIDVQMLADSDHTGGKWMQRSRVSSIVFLNMAPINAKSYLVAIQEAVAMGNEYQEWSCFHPLCSCQHMYKDYTGMRHLWPMVGQLLHNLADNIWLSSLVPLVLVLTELPKRQCTPEIGNLM